MAMAIVIKAIALLDMLGQPSFGDLAGSHAHGSARASMRRLSNRRHPNLWQLMAVWIMALYSADRQRLQTEERKEYYEGSGR